MEHSRNQFFLQPQDYERIKAKYAKFNEPWSPGEVAELKEMAADGVSLKDISEQLQRTPNSVKIKLKDLGLYQPKSVPWKEDDERRLLEEYNSGDSFEQMAERRGRTVGAIISRLVKLHAKLLVPDVPEASVNKMNEPGAPETSDVILAPDDTEISVNNTIAPGVPESSEMILAPDANEAAVNN